jgi:tRNA 2-thiouridine synthesizing protein A
MIADVYLMESGMDTDTQIHIDRELDARGLNCPLPILRTKKSLNDMVPGQVLKVVATDPGSVRDFQAFSKQTGNQLLSSTEQKGEFLFLMRKK